MEFVQLVEAVPGDKLGLALALFVIYKLIDWWRADVRAVDATLSELIVTVTKLTTMIEIQKNRRNGRNDDEG